MPQWQNLKLALELKLLPLTTFNYNGMKIVGQGSQPLTNQEFGLIKALAQKSDFLSLIKRVLLQTKKIWQDLPIFQKLLILWIVQASNL